MLIMESLFFSFSFKRLSCLGWQLFSFRTWNTSVCALLAFRVSAKGSAALFIGLPLLTVLSHSFQYSLLYTVVILIIIWYGEVLFWLCLFGVLNASCTLISTYFPKFGELSAIISLNMFSIPLVCILVPSSTQHICRYGLLIMS
jgi:hypothetical protein